jgi:hypothetical protein
VRGWSPGCEREEDRGRTAVIGQRAEGGRRRGWSGRAIRARGHVSGRGTVRGRVKGGENVGRWGRGEGSESEAASCKVPKGGGR